MSTTDSEWNYSEIWELMHDAIEQLSEAKKLITYQEKSNREVNEKVLLMFAEVATKSSKCCQLVGCLHQKSL